MFLLLNSGYFGCSYSSTRGTLGVLTLQLGVLWVFLLLDSGYFRCSYSSTSTWVVQWLVDASSVAASGCHRWLALLGERVSKMCKSHLAST